MILKFNLLQRDEAEGMLLRPTVSLISALQAAPSRTLPRRYGSMFLAWRNGLDISGDGKLCFGEFCQACRNNDFRGHS